MAWCVPRAAGACEWSFPKLGRSPRFFPLWRFFQLQLQPQTPTSSKNRQQQLEQRPDQLASPPAHSRRPPLRSDRCPDAAAMPRPSLTSSFSVSDATNEVVCPLANNDGSNCRKRCLGVCPRLSSSSCRWLCPSRWILTVL